MTMPPTAFIIDIDRQQHLPIYQQICERFRTAIAAGHLHPGDRVPALRSLATQLNTARGTVELAYTILVDEGYLQMRGAAGTFVSPSLPATVRAPCVRNARAMRTAAKAPRT
nr:GntR family transcriptional regulator [Paraburkholderia guartelaensis]